MKVLYGSQNFGYDSPTSDKDWVEFVYPTWDNILNNTLVNKELKNTDGSITKVKDIRLIPKMLMKLNFSDLQILYSVERYGCEDLQWLFDNRDRIVKHDLWQAFKTNSGMIKAQLKEDTNKSVIRAYAYTILLTRLINIDEFNLYNERLKNATQKINNVTRNELSGWCKQQLIFMEPMYKKCEKLVDIEIRQLVREELKRILRLRLEERGLYDSISNNTTKSYR